MKSILYSLFSILCPLCLTSCIHILDHIGDLQHKWQLTRIEVHEAELDTIATPNDLFLNLMPSCAVAQLSHADSHYDEEYQALFAIADDELRFQFVPDDYNKYYIKEVLCGRFLFPQGYDNLHLHIDSCDGKTLVLADGQRTWTFRAF